MAEVVVRSRADASANPNAQLRGEVSVDDVLAEPFVVASVLLDGSSNAVGGQNIINVPHAELRAGMRVKAVWKPEDERSVKGMSNRGWGGLDGVIEGFEPSGEPDAPLEKIREHMF